MYGSAQQSSCALAWQSDTQATVSVAAPALAAPAIFIESASSTCAPHMTCKIGTLRYMTHVRGMLQLSSVSAMHCCRLQQQESEQLKFQEEDLAKQHELLQMKYGFSDKVHAAMEACTVQQLSVLLPGSSACE